MTSPAASVVPPGAAKPSLARRCYRGLVFALVVGAVGAALSAVPSLFIQSIFVGEAQRCIEAQKKDIAISGEIQTNCAEASADAPVWLPPAIIAGGALIGFVGGFGYGFVGPRPAPRPGDRREESWLPF